MTDTFEVTGETAPVENLSIPSVEVEMASAEAEIAADAVQEPEASNGFVELALAPELVQACKDLGYTQPTAVQSKVIPLALPSTASSAKAASFIDLMVSSQTGSGKTAAFLLPVLHTLLFDRR
jgi:superfamily II DNA/RNA helicase